MKKYFRNHTIRKPSKRWKDELDELSYKELTDGFSENFNIKKKKGIREKLREMRRRRNLKEKEKYGSEEDEEEKEEARKLAQQIKISEEFWEREVIFSRSFVATCLMNGTISKRFKVLL